MTVRPYPLRLSERPEGTLAAPSLIGQVLRKTMGSEGHARSVSILGDPEQRVLDGPFAGAPLRRLAETHPSWLQGDAAIAVCASFHDHGGGTPVEIAGSTIVVHILWCADDRSAHVLAGIDAARDDSVTVEDDLIRRPVSPGDTLVIPAGMPYAFGPGILAYHLTVPAAPTGPVEGSSVPAPTHGLSWFDGYNRRTVCAASPAFALERWKITQPLRLKRAHPRWVFLTNLVEPVAISWEGGSDLIGRAESRLLPASLPPFTLIPDGIAYVLSVSVPDLEHDVVAPLRLAGYRNDEIAAIATLG